MADNSDRNSKAAKRAAAQAVDSTNKQRTYVADPTHIAYSDRGFDIHHLSRRAKIALGFSPDKSDF